MTEGDRSQPIKQFANLMLQEVGRQFIKRQDEYVVFSAKAKRKVKVLDILGISKK